jgi:hypothetical protein
VTPTWPDYTAKLVADVEIDGKHLDIPTGTQAVQATTRINGRKIACIVHVDVLEAAAPSIREAFEDAAQA